MLDLSSKVLYDVDFDVSEVDKEIAVEKMTAAAIKVRKKMGCAVVVDVLDVVCLFICCKYILCFHLNFSNIHNPLLFLKQL